MNTNTLKTTIKTYCPENDSEAQEFIANWCEKCAIPNRDTNGKLWRSSCPILHKADQNNEFNCEFPIQWQRDKNNKGVCTGFKAIKTYPCRTCGKPIPESQKAGRKRDYCNQPCANFEKHRAAMVNSLDEINLSTESNKAIRGDLFRLSNELKLRDIRNEA